MVPPQPTPPGGASPNLTVPPLDVMGVRRTVNYGISAAQTTWNLRSAYNVAALNCLDRNTRRSSSTTAPSSRPRRASCQRSTSPSTKNSGAQRPAFRRPREAYMTQVYNYFALPPTLPSFCDAVLAMSTEAATVKSADLDGFAARSLPVLERVFLRFLPELRSVQSRSWRLAGQIYGVRRAANVRGRSTLPPAPPPPAS
jgi:hypothetical protein